MLVSLFFSLIMGTGVSAQWQNWILFSNSTSFGEKDPQFHKDISFYVFRLPFLQFVGGWIFAALLVVLIVSAVFHYLNGGIRLQSPFQRVTPQVKVHLSVLLGLMALTKTYQYYLAQFALTKSRNGFVDGATYTDVHAHLPALRLLIVISIAAAGLFIVNIWRRGWVFPIIAVGLWGFISIVVGTIYPAVIQKFSVQPNELTKEQPYIVRNIAATREAFGLSNISTKTFNYDASLSTKATARGQADARQRAALRPAARAGRVQGHAGDHALLRVHRRRRRPVQDRRRSHRSPSWRRCVSSTSRTCPTTPGRASTSCTRTVTVRWPPRPTRSTPTSRATCSQDIPPTGELQNDLDPAVHRRVLRRRYRRLRDRRHQGRRAGSDEQHGCHQGHRRTRARPA